MKFKLLFILVCCLSLTYASVGQYSSVIVFKKAPEGVFSFTKKWDYKEGVIKHDDGKFEKTDGEKTEPADTAHQYFTANCKTNVQGGYTVRYVYAKRTGATINLDFAGGLPAYASEFNVTLKNNTFLFAPRIIYPEVISGEKIVYKVTRSKLILYQQNYAVAHLLSGYIKAGFIEVTQRGNKGSHANKYYFEGYFKTALN